jgi:hypothetical protein
VDGYPRYLHEETGEVIANFEGVLFAELEVNSQGCPEYRHRRTGIVFVHLPGGEVTLKGGEDTADVGPFLIMKSPPTSREMDLVLGKGKVQPDGTTTYEYKVWDFSENLGVTRPLPIVAQRYYALGSAWRPLTGTDASRGGRAAPNDFGLVKLRHDPNLGDSLRAVLELTRPSAATVRGAEGGRECGPGASPESVSEGVVTKIVEQKWSGIAAGTKVTVSKGREATIKEDVAALYFSITVENPRASSFALRPPVHLVGQNGKQVSRFRLQSATPPVGDIKSLDAIEVPGEQSILLEFECTLKGFADLRSASPLFIEFPSHGWQLKTDPLPSRDVLYSEED